MAAVLLFGGGAASAQDGVTVGASYTLDTLANVSGGLDTGVVVLGAANLTFDFDGASRGLATPGFHLDLQYLHGSSPTDELVGDAQVVSNIDASDALRVLEAYFVTHFGPGGRGEAKFGLIDLNADFDVIDPAGLFLNSSHGIGPDFAQTGANGPSIFPTTATALTLAWNADRFSVSAGLFDAVAGDPNDSTRTVIRFPGETGELYVVEVALSLPANWQFVLGGWQYSGEFEVLLQNEDAPEPAMTSGNRGGYMQVEGPITHAGTNELKGWIRVGRAADEINEIDQYAGGGLTFGNEKQVFGIAVAHAELGEPARQAAMAGGNAPDAAETAIELTYRYQLTEAFAIQPDLQYVKNPGWDDSIDDAVIVGLRIEAAL